jgi:hypothetical protein
MSDDALTYGTTDFEEATDQWRGQRVTAESPGGE